LSLIEYLEQDAHGTLDQDVARFLTVRSVQPIAQCSALRRSDLAQKALPVAGDCLAHEILILARAMGGELCADHHDATAESTARFLFGASHASSERHSHTHHPRLHASPQVPAHGEQGGIGSMMSQRHQLGGPFSDQVGVFCHKFLLCA
jgi:hypothetical protein